MRAPSARILKVGLVASAITAVVVTGVAMAGPGSTTDPNDTNGPLDVLALRHDNTTTTITYEADVESDPYNTDGGPNTSFNNRIEWRLDFDGNDTIDAILECDINVQATPDCDLLDGDGSGNVDDAGTGTWVDTNTFRVTWNRSNLSSVPEAAGRSTYDYAVQSFFVGNTSQQSSTDNVPDAGTPNIFHDLGSASVSASPCATPTGNATPCPTPVPGTSEPLPTPRPTPSSDPNATFNPAQATAGTLTSPAVSSPTPTPDPNAAVLAEEAANKAPGPDDDLPTSGGGMTTALMAVGALVIGEGLLGAHLYLERKRRRGR